MMSMVILLGWILIVSGMIAAVVLHDADRRLQAFRLPTEPSSSYWFVPIRIRRELYKPEAAHLVDRAWRAGRAMYGLAGIGVVLLAIGYAWR
jgi:hypothetical protein